jgi:hypothetical protein
VEAEEVEAEVEIDVKVEAEEEEMWDLGVAVELGAYVNSGDKHGAAFAAQAAGPVHDFIGVQTRAAAISVAVRR